MRLRATLIAGSLACALAAPAVTQEQPLSSNDPTQALPPPPQTSAPLDLNRPSPAGDAGSTAIAGLSLQGANFTGARAVAEAALRPAWTPYIGRDVTYADLRAIARKAEEIYRNAGYPFVAVVVPPQEIQGGIVNFVVVEGRISDLTVVGDDPTARRQATAAFQPLLTDGSAVPNAITHVYMDRTAVPSLDGEGNCFVPVTIRPGRTVVTFTTGDLFGQSATVELALAGSPPANFSTLGVVSLCW